MTTSAKFPRPCVRPVRQVGEEQGYRPSDRGFDEFYGFYPYGIAAHNPHGGPVAIYRGTEVVATPQNHMESFGDEAWAFLDRHPQEPFFLYLPFSAVHGPYIGAEPWFGMVDADVPANRRKYLEQPVVHLDILPTALAAAGGVVKPKWNVAGVDLLPLLEGKTTTSPHATLDWRFGIQYAVRQGDWKLVKAHINGKPHLFNLVQDLTEQNDLAAQD